MFFHIENISYNYFTAEIRCYSQSVRRNNKIGTREGKYSQSFGVPWKWLWNFHLFYFSHVLRFSGHVSQTEKWLRKFLDTIQGITMDSVCFREIFTKREIMASKRRLLFSKVTSSSRNLSRRSAILISSELMDWLLFTTDSKNQ